MMSDEIRCPDCGELNPAGSRACHKCQAALPTASDGDDDLAWLMRLRRKDEESQPPSDETPATPESQEPPAEEEIPEWLQRVRERNQYEQSMEDGDFAEDDSESLPPADENAASITPDDSASDDWFEQLRLGGMIDPIPQSEANQTPDTPSQESQPNWEDMFREDDSAETPPVEPGSNEESFLPDQSMPESAGEAIQPMENADLQDWLNQLDSAAPQENASGGAPDESIPDWLREPEKSEPVQPQAASPSDETNLSDWLSSLQDEAPAEEQPVEPIESAEPEASLEAADIPDWLTSLGGETPAEEQPVEPIESAEPEAPLEAADIPDWLSSLGGETPAEEQPAEPTEPAEPEAPLEAADIPDWLSSLGGETPAEEQPVEPVESTEPETPLEAADIPDWLSSLQDEAPAEEQPAEPVESAEPEAPLEAADIPDWLSSLGSETPAEEQPVEPIEPEAPLEAADLPDWLSSLGGETPSEEQSAEPTEPEQPFSEGEIPDWLHVPGGETPVTPPADGSMPQPVTPFREDEFNAWLASTITGKEEIETPPAAEETAEELAPSQLPGWLQAMRPVESEQPPVSQAPTPVGRVENSGPLAGMSGALPGENLVLHYHKPPVYSNRLHVSEKQQVNAALLEEALSAPTRNTATQALLPSASNRFARWLIAILLLCAALLPLIGNPVAPVGWSVPSETSAFLSQIDQLPAGSTALIAVEYDPSLAGEMRLASHLAITRLLKQQVNLAIISTTPSGLILTEELIASAQSEVGLNNDDQIASLGYLAGGITAVQQFASNPQTAAPYLFTTGWETPKLAWVQPALKNIQQLSDFSALILMTGSVENGRAWLEQAQPVMDEKPVLMIASAQAAPMLRPYIHSGQAQGMTNGLLGSFALETLTGIPSARSAAYWDAYQYALSAALLFILLGSLAGLMAPLFKRQSAPKG